MVNEAMINQSSVANLTENESSGKFSRFFGVLRRFFLLIFIFALLGLGAGVGFAKMRDETVYTQRKSVIFLATINGSAMTTNLSLTQLYMPTVNGLITKPAFTDKATKIYNERFGEGIISAKKISVQEGNGMILNISYTDSDPTVAANKLDAFIEAAKYVLQTEGLNGNEGLITADGVDFKPIDNVPTESSSNGFVKFVLIGLLGGLVIGFAIAFLVYILDNTVSDKSELERLTGATVIAYIDEVERR